MNITYIRIINSIFCFVIKVNLPSSKQVLLGICYVFNWNSKEYLYQSGLTPPCTSHFISNLKCFHFFVLFTLLPLLHRMFQEILTSVSPSLGAKKYTKVEESSENFACHTWRLENVSTKRHEIGTLTNLDRVFLCWGATDQWLFPCFLWNISPNCRFFPEIFGQLWEGFNKKHLGGWGGNRNHSLKKKLYKQILDIFLLNFWDEDPKIFFWSTGNLVNPTLSDNWWSRTMIRNFHSYPYSSC